MPPVPASRPRKRRKMTSLWRWMRSPILAKRPTLPARRARIVIIPLLTASWIPPCRTDGKASTGIGTIGRPTQTSTWTHNNTHEPVHHGRRGLLPSLPHLPKGRRSKLVHQTPRKLDRLFWDPNSKIWCPVRNKPPPPSNIHSASRHSPREGRISQNVHRSIKQDRYEHSQTQPWGGNAPHADRP